MPIRKQLQQRLSSVKLHEPDQDLSAEAAQLQTELASLADKLEETQQAAASKESELSSLQAESASLARPAFSCSDSS